MDLHVKRFCVRRKGVNYGPNSIIYDVSKDEAEKLISESNGTIEALPERLNDIEKNENSNIEDDDTGNSANTADGTNDYIDNSVKLPSIDPKKTVK